MKLNSTNRYLTELADWAQKKAAKFVMTGIKEGPVNRGDGDKWYGPSRRFSTRSRTARKQGPAWTIPQDYIPSYWAGYHDRTAFYIRDFVHQAPGAELLGYHEENYHMLNAFVAGACAQTDWYAPWALNFDGSIYYMDSPSRRRFVRELTSQYELVEMIARLYQMTGDPRYTEPRMLDFAERILGSFTGERDGIVLHEKNGIPEGQGNIWLGSASYNESGVVLAESGDCIAALYAALRAYGGLCAALGRDQRAEMYLRRAAELRTYFNEVWSIPPDETGCGYVFGIGLNGKKYWKWEKSRRGITGAETCFFMPFKLLTEPGERNDRLLNYIDRMDSDSRTASENIESFTYLPQVFFPYRQAERAWKWMKYIGDRRSQPHVRVSQGLNEDYPELSFTMIDAIIEGLLGLHTDVQSGTISTCPCLPGEIPDLAVTGIRLGSLCVDVRLPDIRSAELNNRSEQSVTWKCMFAGDFERMSVRNQIVNPGQENVNGVQCSAITVQVAPQETVRICAL